MYKQKSLLYGGAMRYISNKPEWSGQSKKGYNMKKSLRQKRILKQKRAELLGAIGIFLACTPIMAAAYMFGQIITGA